MNIWEIYKFLFTLFELLTDTPGSRSNQRWISATKADPIKMRKPFHKPLPAQIGENPSASGWQTIKRVGPYLWPKDEPWVKRRVVLSLMALVAAKLVSVTTPYLYKVAVDALTGKIGRAHV